MAQLVFLGQQALLLPTEEQEMGHLESRRKRFRLMRPSSLEDCSVVEATKGEYWAARAGGRVRQAVKAYAMRARISAGSDWNDCLKLVI